MEEGIGPKVLKFKSPKDQGSQGPMVPGSQGPRYLKATFKYELDSKEGPFCSHCFYELYKHPEEINIRCICTVKSKSSQNNLRNFE